MKNKFFVGIELLFGFVFLFICGIGTFIWFATDAFGEDLFLTILLTCMLAILPSILLLFGVFWVCPTIEVSETGVTKRLLGIKINSFNWEEISEIKCFGNPIVRTISFYKNKQKIIRSRHFVRKQRILFYCSDKKTTIIKNYAPEFIIQQLNLNIY